MNVDVCFALVTLIFFYFVFWGLTVSTAAQQMMSYLPWQGIVADAAGIKGGYPQTDFADSFFPHWRFLADELRAGNLPLWYPFDFAGTRAPETGLFGFYYPPRIILFLLFGPMGGHTAMMMLHVFMAMAFSFRFLSWLGCSISASVVGALLWALNGHNVYSIALEFMLVVAAWVPLSLWAAGRAIQERSWRWAVVSGAATGLTWFGGYANYSYAFGLITAAWWLYLLLVTNRSDALKLCKLPIYALLVAFAVGAAFWMPFLDVIRTAVRVPDSIEEQLKEAIGALQVLRGMAWPQSLKGPVWGYDSESLVYVGIPALLVLPFAFSKRASALIFFVFLGVISFAFITGFRPLFDFGHTFIPMFGAIHPSTIGSQMFMLAVMVLVAFGLDRVRLALNPYPKVQVSLGLAMVASTAVALFALFHASQPLEPMSKRWSFPTTPLTAMASAVQKENHSRLVPAQKVSEGWSPSIFFAGSHGSVRLNSVFGYDSLVQAENYWVAQLIAKGGELPSTLGSPSKAALGYVMVNNLPLALLNRLSAGVIATPPGTKPVDHDGTDIVATGQVDKVYEGKDGALWRSRDALNRAFLSAGYDIVPWGEPALRALLRKEYVPTAKVIVHPRTGAETAQLSSLPNAERSVVGDVQFVRDDANQIRLEVVASDPAILVLNDTWARGWEASVNGVAAPVLRANYGYRAVLVPKGKSQVNFQYFPLPLIAGLTISLLSILVLSGLGVHAWRTRRQAGGQLSAM
jgi:hypothetical protein